MKDTSVIAMKVIAYTCVLLVTLGAALGAGIYVFEKGYLKGANDATTGAAQFFIKHCAEQRPILMPDGHTYDCKRRGKL